MVVVDELSLLKEKPVRVKVQCLDTSKLRATVHMFFNHLGYDLKIAPGPPSPLAYLPRLEVVMVVPTPEMAVRVDMVVTVTTISTARTPQMMMRKKHRSIVAPHPRSPRAWLSPHRQAHRHPTQQARAPTLEGAPPHPGS